MFKKIDCLRIHVPDLDKALAFYRDRLELRLVWRRRSLEAGLAMQDSSTELVLVTEEVDRAEVDVLVDSADRAAGEFARLGGRVVTAPFDIAIGRCAIIEDPWRNRFVILDNRDGPLVTDGEGNVL